MFFFFFGSWFSSFFLPFYIFHFIYKIFLFCVRKLMSFCARFDIQDMKYLWNYVKWAIQNDLVSEKIVWNNTLVGYVVPSLLNFHKDHSIWNKLNDKHHYYIIFSTRTHKVWALMIPSQKKKNSSKKKQFLFRFIQRRCEKIRCYLNKWSRK
jgi:hypothetical protein